MFQKKRLLALFFAGVLPAFSAHAEEEKIENLTQKLIELRAQVEQLNNEINFTKDEHKQEMNYLWSQKNDAKAELERNEKAILKLQTKLEKKIEENQKLGQNSEALKPIFMAQADRVIDYVENSIPFKRAQRLADIKEVKSQVNEELISTQRGFNKLWALVEDEIRLTEENGLYQQSILIEGQQHKKLVDVARLGMMNIYFETPEGQYGQLKDNRFVLVENDNQSEQIENLFESLNKQVRTGLFTLPLSQN
ncbi:DUF3450 family protein [Thiomicrospira sp. WB1]|uniref:DUF3450 family protein n=1 Tax=Thiomicrospira sp. WB1 TaxID=1685380 RepID=UPI0007498E71|nr:DUF3450 family protein [Thiomicrospira sp. WB1]KUJ72443.1 hypothetical protein AVO41_01110 [Thiomicrospira sp. WB1]